MWDETEIVSLDQAKAHVRITHANEDDDLEVKLRQAHGLVLDYVYKSRAEDADRLEEMQGWTEDTAPRGVQAAIMRQFAELVRFRGDDDETKGPDGLDLSPRVRQCLRMYKDPVIA